MILLADLLARWTPDTLGELLERLFDSSVCLGTAIVCGYIVGRERSASKAPVGVRTHVLVCLGAAAFVHLSVMANLYVLDNANPDFARLVQSMATGIGFLGAGAIFKAGPTVHGVSTATSIWLMGAAGTAAGTGAVAFALLISVIAFAVLRWSGEPVAFDDMFDEARDLVFQDMKETLLGRARPKVVDEVVAPDPDDAPGEEPAPPAAQDGPR